VQSPYLQGAFAPVASVTAPTSLTLLAGEVPRDLRGAYVRNGPNPRHAPLGRHHWFDGDGMLHAIRFEDGAATYQSAFVRTDALRAEEEAGESLWKGLLESTKDNPDRRYKDSGNTDVLAHRGELLCLHYMAGRAWRLDPMTLETKGALEVPSKMSAHAKVDPDTGALLYFDYGFRPPFLTYGEVHPDGTHHERELPVDHRVFPHDMAFTRRFAVLMDPPVRLSEKHAAKGRWGVVEPPELPFRFLLVPRDGGEVRSFEASPGYVYHVVDAREDEGAVELVAFRCPKLFPAQDPGEGEYAVMMANLRLRATLHRWRFDLETGACAETALDDRNAEFPTVDDRALGGGARVGYAMTIPQDTARLRFDGVVRYDLQSGAVTAEHAFGPGRSGSEAPFAPRTGGEGGYLISFVHDERERRSEAVILDAETFEVACRLAIPGRVPLGFHACWSPA